MSFTPPFDSCIVFLADGARPDILNREMASGRLANISRYLAERGTGKTILTAFPSTTGPAYLPFLTGCFPGTCNVPGIRWFDKDHYAKKGWSFGSFRSYVGLETFLMNRDMRPNVATAFGIFGKPVSIFNMVSKSARHGQNKTRFSRIWYIYYAHLTDRWNFVESSAAKKLLKALEDDCDFAFVVFPAIDEYSHRSSPFHPRTIRAYHELDSIVGSVALKLKEKGRLEKTLLILTSDHGLSETSRHFDVGPYLEKEKGMKTLFYTQIFKRRFEAVSMVSGNGMAHLYFKRENGWKGRTCFEELQAKSLLLDELRFRPEIDLVSAVGEDGSVHILTEKGHGAFRLHEGMIDYKWSHADPLGLFCGENSVTMSADESLARTFDCPYPDVFVQLSQIFDSPRTGDVVISAKAGHDLRERYEHPEHKASHGSLNAEHMRIPFLMNYPVENPFIRSVDVFPTMLKLTGKTIPSNIDGKVLV